MNFFIFIITLLISSLLLIPITNIIEYIADKFFNKEIEFSEFHLVSIVIF